MEHDSTGGTCLSRPGSALAPDLSPQRTREAALRASAAADTGDGQVGPWLSYRGIKERYSLSESTIRRLRKADRWPRGECPTPGRRVFAQPDCDRAFARLLAEQRQSEAV